ncbi:hypothetical protein J0X19_12795 [Hymenobacter sp. BT186]|uniref:Lipoprotein n=1 Tax=Hymenobacter telluris TaxID=2816474 RepID=A0A939JDY9_9BACT|nr:hypothetical protein [Hymenobacter telluris]MBO0358827.1 hypothetical protein [Hymenobacter telluris]MBW3374853.1 hypothetical protein [Hymenobacter norwichensis]
MIYTIKKAPCLVVILWLGAAACQSNSTKSETDTPATAATAPTQKATPGEKTANSAAYVSATPDSAQQLAPFIPAGYKLLDATSGDLNLDALPDKVLVLQKLNADTTTMGDTLNRPLLLLIGEPNHRYRLAARNERAVMCSSCGGMMGDPYQGITIKKGFFSVEHYGGSAWRWTHITTFKYAPVDQQWYLHREGGDSFHAADPEKVETHIETTKDFGRIAFPDYDYEARLAE